RLRGNPSPRLREDAATRRTRRARRRRGPSHVVVRPFLGTSRGSRKRRDDGRVRTWRRGSEPPARLPKRRRLREGHGGGPERRGIGTLEKPIADLEKRPRSEERRVG